MRACSRRAAHTQADNGDEAGAAAHPPEDASAAGPELDALQPGGEEAREEGEQPTLGGEEAEDEDAASGEAAEAPAVAAEESGAAPEDPAGGDDDADGEVAAQADAAAEPEELAAAEGDVGVLPTPTVRLEEQQDELQAAAGDEPGLGLGGADGYEQAAEAAAEGLAYNGEEETQLGRESSGAVEGDAAAPESAQYAGSAAGYGGGVLPAANDDEDDPTAAEGAGYGQDDAATLPAAATAAMGAARDADAVAPSYGDAPAPAPTAGPRGAAAAAEAAAAAAAAEGATQALLRAEREKYEQQQQMEVRAREELEDMVLRIEKHFKAEQAARKKAEELLQVGRHRHRHWHRHRHRHRGGPRWRGSCTGRLRLGNCPWRRHICDLHGMLHAPLPPAPCTLPPPRPHTALQCVTPSAGRLPSALSWRLRISSRTC